MLDNRENRLKDMKLPKLPEVEYCLWKMLIPENFPPHICVKS